MNVPRPAPTAGQLTTAESGSTAPDVAVVLASAGRPELLAEAILTCRGLSGVGFTGVVSVPDEKSLPADRTLLEGWEVVIGTRGLAAQRNAAIDRLPNAELVAFFDDDAVVRPDYLVHAQAFLAENPEVVALTGRVLLDGSSSAEIPVSTAKAAIEASAQEAPSGSWRRGRELYGCNFVVRGDELRAERFDGRLPLYSWLEDHDIARRLLRRGRLAKVDDCAIVHRAAASGGRQAHERLGYSQVMNPVYLWRKGSFPLWLTIHEVLPRSAKNLLRSVTGSEVTWRRRRLAGNLRALADVLRGRITPERIVDL